MKKQSFISKALRSKVFPSICVLLVLCIFFTILAPATFFTTGNILNVARQVSTTGVIALGMLFVMITGNIDLSIGQTSTFAGLLCATLVVNYGVPSIIAIIIVLAFNAGVGFCEAQIHNFLGIPMMIISLAMMQIFQGLNLVITGGFTIYGLPEGFKFFGQGYIADTVPITVIVWVVLIIVLAFVLTKTFFGRWVFAVGGNAQVAKLSGINVTRVKTGALVLTGALAGLAGIMLMSRANAASPTAGSGMEMDVLTACVLGGTSLAGGEGNVIGVAVGAMVMGVLNNGMVQIGANNNLRYIVTGAVLLLAVVIDAYRTIVARNRGINETVKS